METVSIEKKTFEALMAQWDAFVEKVTALQRKGDGKPLPVGSRATKCVTGYG